MEDDGSSIRMLHKCLFNHGSLTTESEKEKKIANNENENSIPEMGIKL